MEDGDFIYSTASQVAYEAYYKNQVEAQEILNSYTDEEHKIVDVEDHAITIEKPDKSAIIAYRGTDPTNPYDLTADVLIATGYNRDNPIPHTTTRFSRAEDYFKKQQEKYEDITLTGHSLGGTLADYVGRKYNVPAVTFNAGESPLEITRYDAPTQQSKTKVYKTDTIDIVSMSSPLYSQSQQIISVPQTATGLLGSHSLENFLPQKKQPKIKINEIPEMKEQSRINENICNQNPELNFCKVKPKLKLVRSQMSQ